METFVFIGMISGLLIGLGLGAGAICAAIYMFGGKDE